jgi:gallate dioxygenase
MARVIGGIGASHVPTIGVAYDKNRQDFPDSAPPFKGFEPAFDWLKEMRGESFDDFLATRQVPGAR